MSFGFILYYLTNNLFLKVWLQPRRLVQNLTKSLCPSLQDASPHPLKYGENPGKPLAVTVDADDHKFFSLRGNAGGVRGAILHEITLFQVCNLQLELDLGPIVFRNVWFNLSSHRTLDFNQNPIFSDAVWGRTQPRVLSVLHKTNLVRLSIEFLIIQIPNKGLEQGSVSGCGIPRPLGF